MVAVRALLAPWNSTWLVSYGSSRDRPPSVNAQTLIPLAFSLQPKTYRFQPLFIPSSIPFEFPFTNLLVSIDPLFVPPLPFNVSRKTHVKNKMDDES